LFLEVLKILQCSVVIVGRNASRLELAKKCGAAAIVNSSEVEMAKAVAQATQGYGADIAIEAIGQSFAWEAAVSLVRKGGRVCVYGGCAKNTTITLDTYRLHYEQITVSGIFHHTPPLFKKAVSWIVEDKIDLSLFTRERRKLDDLVTILSGQDKVDALKYVIEP
jgi:L-iditol 2-dehydrogenase